MHGNLLVTNGITSQDIARGIARGEHLRSQAFRRALGALWRALLGLAETRADRYGYRRSGGCHA